MYVNENYRKVKEKIEGLRTRAISSAAMRDEEVRAKSEAIRVIDEELSKTGPELFRAACGGLDITPIREKNQRLQKKRAEELVRLGYPEDYTEPKFSCQLCSDTGSVDMKLCSCFKKMLITENIKSSGIGSLIEKQSFDNFDTERYRAEPELYEHMKINVAKAKKFAESFGKPYGNLLLMGKTGVGKTHISTSIAKVVIESGYNVLYDSSQNIVSDFEADRFKSGYGPYEPKADKYLECDLLIIDDLGTEFVNQFTISCLYNLINTRQNRALPTVVSTNLTTEELITKYEGRISSRLLGAGVTVLMFDGDDYRIYAERRKK